VSGTAAKVSRYRRKTSVPLRAAAARFPLRPPAVASVLIGA
jgi:hypothetical protein